MGKATKQRKVKGIIIIHLLGKTNYSAISAT